MARRSPSFTPSIYIKILSGFGVILFLSFVLGYGTLNELGSVNISIGGIAPRIEILGTVSQLSGALDVLHTHLSSSGGATKDDVDALLAQIAVDMNGVRGFQYIGEHQQLMDRLSGEVSTTEVYARMLFTGDVQSRMNAARNLSGALLVSGASVEELSQAFQGDITALLGKQQEVIRAA